MKFVETRKIKTPDGSLEIEMTDVFLSKVREHFGLGLFEYVTDDHLRMFVYGATKSAIDKAEVQGGFEQSA